MNSRSNFASRAASVTVSLFGVASVALASPPHGRYVREYREPVYARVVEVEPIVHRVKISTPDRECWNETQEVYPRPRSSAGSMILGGLIGGVIGHQFGHGNRSTPTLAGAVVGAAIGNEVGQQQADRNGYVVPVQRDVQRCSVTYREEYEERIDGYRVTYEYDGREYTTRLPYDPGKRIRINVAVSPDYRGERYDD